MQLPSTFTNVRAMSMMASAPSSSAIPATGKLNEASVPVSTTIADRGIPATPLLVSISVSIIISCWLTGMWIAAACAMNTEASER